MNRSWSGRARPRLDSWTGRQEGFALFGVMFVLIVLSALVVVSLTAAADERLAGRAVRNGVQPFYAAQAGVAEILSEWSTARYDTLAADPGDSTVVGWRSLEDGSLYRGVIRRVDGGSTTRVYTLTVTGRGTGAYAGEKTVRRVFTASATSFPTGLVTNGDTEIPGNPTLSGCAGVFSNGDLDVSGTLTVDGEVQSAGNVSVSGDIVDSSGNEVEPEEGAEPIPIPQMDPADYCEAGDPVDWRLENGTLTRTSDGQTWDINGNEQQGWKWDSGDNTYELKGNQAQGGTVCLDGSLKISDNPGSETSALPLSVFAEGYVEISGNPFLQSSHSDEILIVATGDLKLNGNSSFANPNFGGLIYGGAQCEFSGTPSLVGNVICYDNPDPPGVKNMVDLLKINGDITLQSSCLGGSGTTLLDPVPGGWSQITY